MVNHSRIALRVPPETKERWQAEAHAEGLTLSAYVVGKVDGARLDPRLESLLLERVDDALAHFTPIVVAKELELLLAERLAPSQDSWPVPAEFESLPLVLMPKDFDPSCIDADLHNRGTSCATCSGNGLKEARAL
jgi:hypothetical protein